jgi:carbohydrate kinase (thermoresistant glucokinase family)
MGVAGSGKSTVGAVLAERLDKPFLDADDYHPPANVDKMTRGIALSDDDRWPWLDRLGAALHAQAQQHGAAVAACSALKRRYRQRLREAAGERVLFVYLHGDRELIAARMAARTNHFMPPALLDSQFATLEEPGADENALIIDIGPTATELAKTLHNLIGTGEPASP